MQVIGNHVAPAPASLRSCARRRRPEGRRYMPTSRTAPDQWAIRRCARAVRRTSRAETDDPEGKRGPERVTDDCELAAHHAPILFFDREEPFLPSRVGYSVLRKPADSPVDPRRRRDGPAPLRFDLSGLEGVIEYGIWWDWDIQHLYELEAAWVYLGKGGVLRVEASWHGRFHEMLRDGKPALRGDQPVLFSQPGKHALAPEPSWFAPREEYIEPCRDTPGTMGVLVTPLFEGRLVKQAGDDARAAAYLQSRAFTPAFHFDREFAVGPEQLCPWTELEAWIPERVTAIMEALRHGCSID
jgi:hypothetical protein